MAMTVHLFSVIIGATILFPPCLSDVKCRNDFGDAVDWYILYKLPKSADRGLSYLYMDENTKGWNLSTKEINSATGCVGRTLKPLLDFYDKKTEGFGYLLYNDQPLKEKGSAPASFGHSKGVVMLDRQTGVWLSHSTPNFPNYQSKNFWPNSGKENGQTFMCITFPYKQFKVIGLQLQYIHAFSFDFVLPTTFHEELRCVGQRSCYPKKEPWFTVTNLTSSGGRNFRSFAKYTRFKDDLYSGLVTRYLAPDLFVKSWGKMKRPLPSNCSSSTAHPVYNVAMVKLPGMKAFSINVDHSKWCVTSDGEWTCIADMNREASQMGRGGGAICTNDQVVGRAFRSSVYKHEPCTTDMGREL